MNTSMMNQYKYLAKDGDGALAFHGSVPCYLPNKSNGCYESENGSLMFYGKCVQNGTPSPSSPVAVEYVDGDGAVFKPTHNLPSGFTEVEWIKADGESWIDTLYVPNGNTVWKSVFERTENTTPEASGKYPDVGNARIKIELLTTHTALYITTTGDHFVRSPVPVGIKQTAVLDVPNKIATMEPFGYRYEGYGTSTWEDSKSIYLFAYNANNGVVERKSKFRIYYNLFSENGVAVQELIPCFRNSDNEPGMYDTVNGVFYANQGTGRFSIGGTQTLTMPDLYGIGDIRDTYEPCVWVNGALRSRLTRRIGKIDSYNGESVGSVYMSSTGELSTGATVYYPLAIPVITLGDPQPVQSYGGATNIFHTSVVQPKIAATVVQHKATPLIYGFHVDSTVSDPSNAVTYLNDAVGMTPAHMDYTNGVFDYGSWADAFFMPKPCMLRSDGTVAYYLNPNNYSKKADGTASDITNEAFDGNAMMEWGQNGKRIYYAIVPDASVDGSYSVYISDTKVNENYNCWSFYDKNNNLMPHFYTPIYSGSLDSNNKLRSLSGKAIMQNKTGAQEMAYAKANGTGWYIEVWADKTLMFLLLYLMGKSLDVQTTFGQGHTTGGSSSTPATPTGQLDDKGLFFGYSSTTNKVKVFGMEDQWGELCNRTAGLMLNNGTIYYKMTAGTADGSTATDYTDGTTTTGMLNGGASLASSGYVKKMRPHDGKMLFASAVGGNATTYYCDYLYQNKSGVRFATLGGDSIDAGVCGFYVNLNNPVSDIRWYIAAALSCKPLIQ